MKKKRLSKDRKKAKKAKIKDKKIKLINKSYHKQQNLHPKSAQINRNQQQIDRDLRKIYKKNCQKLQFFLSTVKKEYFDHQSFEAIDKTIQRIKQKLIEVSLDYLLEIDQHEFSEGSYNFQDLSDYLKVVINQIPLKKRKILIQHGSDSLYLTTQKDRHHAAYTYKGEFISTLQRETIQKRSNFMEKIQSQQEKYSSEQSFISPISAQLLFMGKIYTQNSTRIKELLSGIEIKRAQKQEKLQQQDLEKQYRQLVIRKNIFKALKDIQITQPILQQKKNSNANFDKLDSFEISNNCFKSKQNPKKETIKATSLQKSCSCCFSNFLQAVNQFTFCRSCHLYAHQYCLDLKKEKCGSCQFRLQRKNDQQQKSSCVICENKGQMLIKTSTGQFIHNFCGFFHGLWKLQKNPVRQEQNSIHVKSNFYQNPQQAAFLKVQNQNPPKTYKLIFNTNRTSKKIEKKTNMEKVLQTVEDLEEISIDFQNPCQICKKQISHDWYISCSSCQKKYHAYCAYFVGFRFQVQQNCRLDNPLSSPNNCSKLYCCGIDLKQTKLQKQARCSKLKRSQINTQS